MIRKVLKSNEQTCSVCGKKVIVLNRGFYVYKTTKPKVQYQCSEKCWQKAKSVRENV